MQAPAHTAHLLSDGQYAVSAAPGERHVAIWSTLPPKKAKKAQPAVTALSLEDPVASIHVCPCTTSPRVENGGCSTFQVAAVSVRGAAYVWECSTSGQTEGAALKTRLLARVRVGAVNNRG
jgi:U3 small nucleolar RNA-associated protein 5